MYVMIHQGVYADLEQYGEVVSEEKQVEDLLQGIKDNSPAINAAKGTILATPMLRNNFHNAVTHLSTTMQLNMSQQDSCNISTTNTTGSRNINRGGWGYRNAGHSDNHGGQHGCGHNIYLGLYSPEQWRKLSAEDKQKVYERRQKSSDAQSQQQQVGQKLQGRGISAVSFSQNDDIQSAVTSALTGTQTNLDSLILNGALNGSAAIGDKRSPADTAGSQCLYHL